jgi:hypothetical protein
VGILPFGHSMWLTITPRLYARAPTSTVKYSTHDEKWASLSLWEFTLMPRTSPTLTEGEHDSGMMKIGEDNLMPLLIGHWAPQWVTDDELYCASLLALLKPWRALADLHSPGLSFTKALDCFLDGNNKCWDIVDNIIWMHRMGETNFRYIVIVALECKIIWQPSHLTSTPKNTKGLSCRKQQPLVEKHDSSIIENVDSDINVRKL